MHKPVSFAFLMTILWLVLGAVHAEETLETRAIDARVVRVRLDGMINLKLVQGAEASLQIIGEKGMVGKVRAVQTADTLELDSAGGKINRSSLRAELVLPQLREVVSEGMGTTEVSGFSGDEIDITLDGAGSMKIAGAYKRMKANLGGMGSLHVWVSDSDNVELDLRGAGYVTIGGRSRMLRASLGGLGGLNAQQFQADSVDIDLSGLGNATVHARTNANLHLSGLGSVTVYGKPLNRNVSVDGLGKVSWK
jgi:Putative auto-transporter adhesin, head GIN domain